MWLILSRCLKLRYHVLSDHERRLSWISLTGFLTGDLKSTFYYKISLQFLHLVWLTNHHLFRSVPDYFHWEYWQKHICRTGSEPSSTHVISIVKHESVHLKCLKFCQYITRFLHSHSPHCLYEKVYSCAHCKIFVFPAFYIFCSCVEAPADTSCDGKKPLLVMVPNQDTEREIIEVRSLSRTPPALVFFSEKRRLTTGSGCWKEL